MGLKGFFRDTVIIIVLAAVMFVGLQFTLQRYGVDGPSMLTTFHDKQQLLVNKMVYRIHDPERGDVIIFTIPGGGDQGYIKRIIGLPGEYVEIRMGTVYIHQPDGTVFPLDEPYVSDPARISYLGKVIPGNQYFVMGDNRNNSSDSRSGYTLPSENIIGKVWLSLWPLDSLGVVTSYAYSEK
jgi:signal peptidase I